MIKKLRSKVSIDKIKEDNGDVISTERNLKKEEEISDHNKVHVLDEEEEK